MAYHIIVLKPWSYYNKIPGVLIPSLIYRSLIYHTYLYFANKKWLKRKKLIHNIVVTLGLLKFGCNTPFLLSYVSDIWNYIKYHTGDTKVIIVLKICKQSAKGQWCKISDWNAFVYSFERRLTNRHYICIV